MRSQKPLTNTGVRRPRSFQVRHDAPDLPEKEIEFLKNWEEGGKYLSNEREREREYDSPKALLANKRSRFYKLVEELKQTK